MNVFEWIWSKIKYIYREYEFLTATTVMEDWERWIVHGFLVSMNLIALLEVTHKYQRDV